MKWPFGIYRDWHPIMNSHCLIFASETLDCAFIRLDQLDPWITGLPQVRKKSGKSENLKKSGKSQGIFIWVRKFWNSPKSQEKVKKKWKWYQSEGLIPNFDRQCHDGVAQSCNRQKKYKKIVFYSFWTFCKSSHDLVDMAHRNDKSWLFYAKWSPQ